jgi:hypothetical protein
MKTAEDYGALWKSRLGAHRWIVCSDVAAVFAPLMKAFTAAGAPKPLLLAGSEGTGPQPDPDECELIVLGTTSETMLGGIRAFHDALRALPPEVMARVDAWDPDREAVVMASFLDTEVDIGGRRTWGGRPEAWLALEDKMVIDDLWDAIGVVRAPRVIVDNTTSALTAASLDLDEGAGVVWTADNRDGWHGGAEYSRYVANPADAREATDFMAKHANRVRVMPFLEGVPCAIHGVVFPDHVAAFRPVEMVVFREAGTNRFRYASCATSWDPAPQDREEMRLIARRVGSHLREHHDFRGAFTIDGVVTAEGFRPTELNPRYGAGIGTIARTADVPMLGISRMLIERDHAELDGQEIERIVVEAADRTRSLGGFTTTSTKVDETEDLRVLWNGTSVATVEEEQDANATLTRGPATHGSLVRFSLDPEATPAGTFAAPIVAAAFRLADDLWDIGIGELIPATPA